MASIIKEKEVSWHSWLIKPDLSWPEVWSPHAAKVHGISRKALEGAPPASAVAQAALARLTHHELIVVSDSPRNDQPWMDRLVSTYSAQVRIKIISIWEALSGRTEQDNLRRMREWLRENKGPHRAGPDAARLARAVLECHLGPRSPDDAAAQENDLDGPYTSGS